MRFSAARASVITSVCTFAATGKFVGWATKSAPAERERARHLREAEVVADLDPDPAQRRLPDVELVAGGREAVDAEERQVRLPVGADQTVRPDEDGGITEVVSVALEHAAADVHAQAGTLALERLDRRAGHLLRERHPLLEAVEHVAGDRALRKHEQLGSCGSGLLEPRQAGLEIPLGLADHRVELRNRDSRHQVSLIV